MDIQTEDISYSRLLAAQELIAACFKSDYSEGARTSVFESRSSEEWKIFSQDLARLDEQIRNCGSDSTSMHAVSNRGQSHVPTQAAGDCSSFISQTFEAMTCTCGKTSPREMRFKLGAYKTPKSVKVDNVTILTKESATKEWDEIRLHRTLEPT